jgi:phage baseplate assembly protein W
MASRATRAEFVNAVAEEISSGIDRAVRYWLGRIEVEVVDRSLTTTERIYAIEQILREYKNVSEAAQIDCASA